MYNTGRTCKVSYLKVEGSGSVHSGSQFENIICILCLMFRRLVTQNHVNSGLKALHCSLLAEEFPTGSPRFTSLTVTQNL